MSFRESDAVAPKLHPTYAKKPLSMLQLNNQLSHLEAPRPTYATVHDVVPEPIRASHDEVYDPSHPDADWSGLVKRDKYTRKHGVGHKSQQVGIVQTDNGIISKEEKKEFPRKRRDCNPQYADNHIIGGVLEPDHQQYMTDMNRGNIGLKTNMSQLNLKKQQMLKQDQHFNNENQRNQPTPRSYGLLPPDQSLIIQKPNNNSSTKVTGIGMSKSLLSNIGDMLVKDIPISEFPGEKTTHKPANYNPRSIYNK